MAMLCDTLFIILQSSTWHRQTRFLFLNSTVWVSIL